MTKSILVSFAILALSTSAALAATHHRTHHRAAMNAYDMAGPPVESPVGWGPGMSPMGWGGVNNSDYTTYMKNLHDSGYNPKNNYDSNGTLRTQ